MRANHQPVVDRDAVIEAKSVDSLSWLHDEELRDACISMRRQGYTAEAIGLMVGRSKNRVCQILNRAGVP